MCEQDMLAELYNAMNDDKGIKNVSVVKCEDYERKQVESFCPAGNRHAGVSGRSSPLVRRSR